MNFPNYIQADATDCGPTCLRIVAKYFGKHFSAPTLREISYKSRIGVSLLSISDAAEKIGFRTQGCKITFDALQEAQLPCIAHWNQKHFVVVYKIKKDFVYVSDPAVGLIKYNKGDFLKYWASTETSQQLAGVVLLLTPTPEFYLQANEKLQKFDFTYLVGYLRPYRKLIFQLLLSFLVASLLSLMLPFLTQSLVDVGIGTNNIDFILLVLIAQLALTVGQTSIGMIRSWLMLYLTSRIGIFLISDFLMKLMRLPIRFFDTKIVGDIVQRIADNNRVQSFLTGSLISMSFSVFIFIIYSFIMAYYDWRILTIFYIGSGLYVGWICLFLRKRKELDYMRFGEAASNQSNLYQLITGMQEIKLNNCEKQKRWQWERIQVRLFKLGIKGLNLSQNQQMGSFFINQSKNIIISYVTAKSVIDGDITLGMMFSIQYILGQLNSPISDLMSFIQSAQDSKISLERLGEIHQKEDEEKVEDQKLYDIPDRADIRIENLTFHYDGPKSSKVLNNISLVIPSNRVTAIVGASGSGKTTLLKLLLGYYPPTEGKIMVGNFELSQYAIELWRSKCGIVMQDGFIFSDTIANNIAVADEFPDKTRLSYAIQMANIHEYIENLPLKYNTKVGSEGVGFSYGQKQRILIARAIYKNPEFVFFDEATSALDADNEKIIIENLNEVIKGKTVIIVAHRLSTVKHADKIVVLKNGMIAEIGSHDELTAMNGEYYRLVKNQLDLTRLNEK